MRNIKQDMTRLEMESVHCDRFMKDVNWDV